MKEWQWNYLKSIGKWFLNLSIGCLLGCNYLQSLTLPAPALRGKPYARVHRDLGVNKIDTVGNGTQPLYNNESANIVGPHNPGLGEVGTRYVYAFIEEGNREIL
jgi:hypothetical protein